MFSGIEIFVILGLLGLGQFYLVFQYYNNTFRDGSDVPVLCYFALDSTWPDNGTLHPALNATLCNHIMFIDTVISSEGDIVVADPTVVPKYFNKIPDLKKTNPKLKVLVTNGGGGPAGFTLVLATEANRTRFVQSSIPFMEKYGFDGLDLDFEFPGLHELPHQQRENFTLLCQELRDTFDNHAASGGKKYLLSAAVGAGRIVMEVYHVPQLAKSLDFINLMTYDLHSFAIYDPITGYNSPLYPKTWREKIVLSAGNVGWSTHEWNKRGMPKSKIMVGIPTYTHAWTLELPELYHGPNAPAKDKGKLDGGSFTEVCNFLRYNGTVEEWDDDAYVPYAYNGDQWLSFDNKKSVAAKASWSIKNGFGGIMVYDVNSDDYSGNCGLGKFPLTVAINKALGRRLN